MDNLRGSDRTTGDPSAYLQVSMESSETMQQPRIELIVTAV
jgi:hypothetical protein